MPILALFTIGLGALLTSRSDPAAIERLHIGYVDEVGIFGNQTDQGSIRMVPFASKKDADLSLHKKDVSEYIIIPSDYITSGTIQRYTLEKELNTPAHKALTIKRFLSENLLEDILPPEMVALIVSPLNLEVTLVTTRGDMAVAQNNMGNVIIPAVFALLLSFALMFGASSLVSGLGEEKESRLIEVLFSSVSIRQLLISKVLALGMAELLQVLAWLVSAPLLLNLASATFGGFMAGIEIPANFLLLGIIYFVLGYLLFAVLSIGIGAISSNARGRRAIITFLYSFRFCTSLVFRAVIQFSEQPTVDYTHDFPHNRSRPDHVKTGRV